MRQAELESEIAQVHEERNEAIRSLLSEEMSRSTANPEITGRPVTAPTQQRGQWESQEFHSPEEAFGQQSSESNQTGLAPRQTSPPPQPPKNTNPQGLRAKLDRGPRGQGGYINADILREIADYGRQTFRQGMEYFDWAMRMLTDLGEQIGPYLKGIFGSLVAEYSGSNNGALISSNASSPNLFDGIYGQNTLFEKSDALPRVITPAVTEFSQDERTMGSVRLGQNPNGKKDSGSSKEANQKLDPAALAREAEKAAAADKPIEGGLYERIRDYGQSLYRAGVEYLDWADQMFRDLGRATISVLGRIWREITNPIRGDLPRNLKDCLTRLRNLQGEWNEVVARKEQEMNKPWSLRTQFALLAIGSRLDAIVEESRDLISVPGTERRAMKFFGIGVPQWMKQVVEEGEKIVTRYTSPDLVPVNLQIQTVAGDTSSYTAPGIVELHLEADAWTFAHEAIHDVEYVNDRIHKITSAFLKKRADGKPPRPLRDITGDPNDPSDLVYEDRWIELGGNAYTEKIYDSGYTEILSMGIERLHEDPMKFFAADPEFFEVVVKCLRNW